MDSLRKVAFSNASKNFISMMVLAVVWAGLVSCGRVDDAVVGESLAAVEESPTAVEKTAFGVVTYQREGVGGHLALLTGVLTVEQGCLAVTDGNVDGIVFVQFPEDQVEYMADGGVRLFGKEYHLGRGVHLGGGYGGAPSAGATIPDGCDVSYPSVWFLASSS